MSSDSDDGEAERQSADRPMFEGQQISKGKRRDSERGQSKDSESDET